MDLGSSGLVYTVLRTIAESLPYTGIHNDLGNRWVVVLGGTIVFMTELVHQISPGAGFSLDPEK